MSEMSLKHVCTLLIVGAATAAGQTPQQPPATWQQALRAAREAAFAADPRRDAGAERRFVSNPVRGGDAAVHVKVAISGWKDLYLIVTDEGDYNHDVANWGDAKLISADGSSVWLDEMEPVSVKQGWGTFRRDRRSAVGGPLKIGDRVFSRGIGTHAVSVIHYRLDREYAFFEAYAGIDASRGKNGCVRFVVSPVADAPRSPDEDLWQRLCRQFTDPAAHREMARERADGIWNRPWSSIAELGMRYAAATRGDLKKHAAQLAAAAVDEPSLQRVREVYHRSIDAQEAAARLKSFDAEALRLAIADLTQSFGNSYPQGPAFMRRLDELLAAAEAARNEPLRLAEVVAQLEELRRRALLANPLLNFERLLLVRRSAANLGLPHNWESNSSLPRSGFDNEIAVLSPVAPGGRLSTLYRPPDGRFVGDVDLHYDADRLLFSSVGKHNRWQVFEMRIDGSGLRELTGEQDDVDSYDACYLPNGDIIFTSTACFIGVPCVYGASHVTNLYRMDADGRNIRRLTVDQEHNWCPAVMNNGRVLYQRWEYTDTPHSNTRLLFTMNPDGTSQMAYYGSNSYWPNSIFYARPVPDHPTKVVGIVTGHHGVARMGELVIFDPARSTSETEGVVQRIPGRGKPVEPIVRDQLVNESWPKFLHPFPLSEKYMLVSAKPTPQSHWGIYLVDVFDNMLLLAELPGHALLEPVPLRKTPRPPVVPDRVDLSKKDAVVYIADIYRGQAMRGVPRGTVKELRIFAYHFSYQGMGGLLGVLGMDGPWDIRRIMGTVPVEEDGSAAFRVPAWTPISIQPLDAEGKAVQLMRSWMTAMPGENVSCVGCHEKTNDTPPARQGKAFSRPPSEITPWRGPTRGFSYKREVQPVINRYCVGCHDGSANPSASNPDGAPPDLRGDVPLRDFRMVTPGNGGKAAGKFSVGYANLARYVRRPGIESDYHVLMPCEFHADTTHLVQLLMKGHYGVRLDPEAWDRLITWIDLNAPYHATWHEEIHDPGRQRQRRRELAKLYGGLDEDPEAVIETGYNPGPFVMPAKDDKPVEVPKAAGWPFDAQEAARRQSAAGPVTRMKIDIGADRPIEMVLIPAGEFVMGDPAGYPNEQPPTRVRITAPFWMSACEITNSQYAVFDPAHDSHVESKQAYQFGIHGYPVNEPAQPVVRVSWVRAMEFCRWLSQRTGRRFTLPTEAQWEWACRAGSAEAFFFGPLDADFSRFANLADARLARFASDPYTVDRPLVNPSHYDDYVPKDMRFDDGGLVSVAVGSYKANAWGLHDMHGNVAEWTSSDYVPYPYRGPDGAGRGSRRQDGQAQAGAGDAADALAAAAVRKVVRGGSWRDRPRDARSAVRFGYPAWRGVFNVGFRIVCEEPCSVAGSSYNEVKR